MSEEKRNKMESVRKRWAKQHQQTPPADVPAVGAGGGSHFAKPSSVQSVRSAAPAGGGKAPTVLGAAKHSAPAPGGRENDIAVLSPEQQHVQRHLKITGVSGEMPGLPLKLKRSPALPYSRYNKRYVNRPFKLTLSSLVHLFDTKPVEGAPAYSWVPFLAYAGAGVAASLIWAVYAFAVAGTPLVAGSVESAAGLAVLLSIVLGGLAVAAVVVALTSRGDKGFEPSDALASALGKTGAAMVLAVAAWIGANAAVTYIAL